MFAAISPDGVILSTPTPLHVSQGLECIERSCPVLVEKPLATSAVQAKILTDAAEYASVPLLVGHHRRHNPLIQKAKELIVSGEIGNIRALQATCWFYKPDEYFDIAPWRTQKGAGPVSVNLVHDIDLMRYFCGEIISVQAQMAPSIRGFDNEDLAAAVLKFESGVIGTVTVSDSIVSPWSWELTSREYPIYPMTSESCYLLGGSEGSLSVPDLKVWSHKGERNWWNPISGTIAPRDASDPLINQITNFADVIRGDTDALVTGLDGLKTLLVIEAIQKAAQTQNLIEVVNPSKISTDGVAAQ
jgi:predicted dehydrogenase